MSKLLASLCFAPIFLWGCSTPLKPYTPPSGAATAELRSSIIGGFTRYQEASISVWHEQGHQPGITHLFNVRKGNSEPKGYVTVVANAPLKLHYSEAFSGGYSCQVTIEFVLREGGRYSLVGGVEYEKSSIPFFPSTRKCVFGVKDESTGLPVPVR